MSTEKPTTVSYREGMALLGKELDRKRAAWFVWKAECQERGEWPPTMEAVEKHKAEVGTRMRLGKPQHPLSEPAPPSAPADTHEYSCGPPGHDYTDHLVEYEGLAILDITLPEGAKGRPLTGPLWTEVDYELWSDSYKRRHGFPAPPRRKWVFDDNLGPASFAEMRWEWFKTNPESFRAKYGEEEYLRCVDRANREAAE